MNFTYSPSETETAAEDTGPDTEPTLEDLLDAIPHLRIDLMGEHEDGRDCDVHRPEIKVWASAGDEESQAYVTLMLSALWGQSSRYVDLVPDEARKLAKALTDTADAVEQALAAENYKPVPL